MAAMESLEEIREALKGSDMVFVTAGLGGGTGTGAAPIVAKASKELGALTVAVVTKPFSFEGKYRSRNAEEGWLELQKFADTIITVPNDRLLSIMQKNSKLSDMLSMADNVLLQAVKGITDLIMMPGLVNLDFADVRTTMSRAGMAIMGIGIASGENRAVEAAERAISHPLLEDISISGAKGVLMNITCNSELTMEEMTEASDRIYQEVGEDAEIIWGTVIDDSLGDEMRVTVIATGIGNVPGSLARSTKIEAFAARGKIRDLTPAEMQAATNFDEPTFMREQKAVGESSGATYRGYKGIIIDNNDLDVPTFLRRKAD